MAITQSWSEVSARPMVRGARSAVACMTLAFMWSVSPVLAENPPTTSRPASQPSELVVALLQMSPKGSDRDANLAKADRFCRDAAARGADIALMPEMWSVGYGGFNEKKPDAKEVFQAKAVATDSPWVQHFAGLSRNAESFTLPCSERRHGRT